MLSNMMAITPILTPKNTRILLDGFKSLDNVLANTYVIESPVVATKTADKARTIMDK